MKRNFYLLICLAAILSSCIGTDEVDDPIVGASIETDQIQVAMLLGNTGTVSGTYFNQYGLEEDLQIIWQSEDESIASVDIAGTVTGEGLGQTNITGNVGSTQSDPVLITVVATETEVAMVTVSSDAGNQIDIDAQLQLNLDVTNLLGEAVTGDVITWTSMDEEIFTVDDQGVVTGVSNGTAHVYATVDGVESNRFFLIIGPTSRTGTFQGSGGYETVGSVELFLTETGELKLTLSDDFDSVFANGTFIYLSNSTNGVETATTGLEIVEIFEEGGATYSISAVDPDVTIADYQHVIILCKPASAVFGKAELD